MNDILIIIPALNEERNLRPTYDMCKRVMARLGIEHRILICNDGSTDGTAKVADEIARSDYRVATFTNRKTQGLGACYKHGINFAAIAKAERLVLLPGDNDMPEESFHRLLCVACRIRNDVDMVIPYPSENKTRSKFRLLLSRAFVRVVRYVTKTYLDYYNGCVVHKVRNLTELHIETNSFAYQAEILVKLLRKGKTYIELGIDVAERPGGRTKAFRFSNVLNVLKTVWRLRA